MHLDAVGGQNVFVLVYRFFYIKVLVWDPRPSLGCFEHFFGTKMAFGFDLYGPCILNLLLCYVGHMEWPQTC